MKRIHLSLLLMLAISLNVRSQDFKGKNMFKVNLSSFALGGFHLQYERQIARKITVALGYGSIPTSTIPFKSFIEKQINDPSINVADFRLGTSVITPEIRFYTGKKGAFHGLYFAPYARIGSYNIAGPIKYSSTATGQRTAIFDGKINTVTGGLLIGSNFSLSKRLYLDWWISGASIGGATGNLSTITQLTTEEQTSIKRALDNVDIPFTKIQSQVNSNGAVVTTNGTMVGIRGLGINFGFRF